MDFDKKKFLGIFFLFFEKFAIIVGGWGVYL
jgi:hypothetical protein